MKGRNAEKLRAFGQSTPRATKKIESGPLKKYIYCVCIFFKHLRKKNAKISSSVPNSTQYKAKKLLLLYPHN